MIFRKITIFGQSCQKITKKWKNTKIQFALKIYLKAKNQFLARFWKAPGLLFRFLCLKIFLSIFALKTVKNVLHCKIACCYKKTLKMNLLMRNFYEPKIWTLSFLNPVSECLYDPWFNFYPHLKFGKFRQNLPFFEGGPQKETSRFLHILRRI